MRDASGLSRLLSDLCAAEIPASPEEELELDLLARRLRDAERGRGLLPISPFQAFGFWVMKRRAGEVGERFGREHLAPLWQSLKRPPWLHLPLLAEHFRTRFNEQHQLAIDPLGSETLSALESAPWRGNVRELERTMKVAMVFRYEGALQPEDLRVRGRVLGAKWRGGSTVSSLLARLPVSRRVQTALRIAGERGVVTRRDLARECGVSGEIARQALVALARLGFVRRSGADAARCTCFDEGDLGVGV